MNKQKWPAVDLLEKYLAEGYSLSHKGDRWWLSLPYSIEGISGKTLRDLLLNLILVDGE